MKSKTKRLVCGVGLNDAIDAISVTESVGYVDGKLKRRQLWVCPFYRAWVEMLRRCYSDSFQERQPTYLHCSVVDEWLVFSNFKSWMEKQDWEGKQLDKDILFPGSKIYSPDTCVFVSLVVNMFIVERGALRGEFPIGVCRNKTSQKFQASCSNPFTKKNEYLGSFTTPDAAHQTWLARKLELAILLAGQQADSRVATALIERYTNYVNIKY